MFRRTTASEAFAFSPTLFLKRAMIASAICALAVSMAACRTGKQIVPPSAADRDLAAALSAAEGPAQGTPGKEAANFYTGDWPKNLRPFLSGDKPATAAQLQQARNVLSGLLQTAEKGPSWPKPAPIRVPRAEQAPTIDGDLSDAAWRQAWTATNVFPFNEREKSESPATTWRLTWDTEYLYVAFECQDSEINAPEIERDGPVYNHDCVEVFLLPDFRTSVYWEIVVSPSGMIYDGLNAKKNDGWGSNTRSGENVVGLRIGRRQMEKGYCIELAIPFRELPSYTRGNAPQPGDRLHLMLARLDKQGEVLTPYAFVPLLSWGHNIWNHVPIDLAP